MQGNIKSKEIVQSLLRCLEGGEAVPGTTVKARSTVQALADTAGSAGSDASQPDKATAFNAVLAEAAAQADDDNSQSSSHEEPAQDTANTTKADEQHQQSGSASANLHPPVTVPEDQSALPQAPSITACTSEEAGTSDTEATGDHTVTSEDVGNSDAPHYATAAAEGTNEDCIGNPLYEEPDPVRAVPMPAVDPAFQPALQPAQSALPSAAEVQTEASGSAIEHGHEGRKAAV